MAQAEKEEKTESPYEMSKEDFKFLMKALWESLIGPAWTKDTLIAFGKVVFTKVSLKEMDDKNFELLFPYLKKITETLGTKLAAEAERKIEEETSKIAASSKTEDKPSDGKKPAPEVSIPPPAADAPAGEAEDDTENEQGTSA